MKKILFAIFSRKYRKALIFENLDFVLSAKKRVKARVLVFGKEYDGHVSFTGDTFIDGERIYLFSVGKDSVNIVKHQIKAIL